MADLKPKDPSADNQNAPTDIAARKLAQAVVAPVVTGDEHCCIAQYWAVLETNGSLVRGHNVWRVAHLATGIYEVIFTGDVSAGAFVATIGRPGIFTEPTGEICVALRYSTTVPEIGRGVWVQTFNSAGAPSDRAFHLLVTTAG
ncbi:MAG: hypothetical protein DMF06_17350 [Verrucomicrobia bacterium]|nr:MAG: hypothetical protein DMF06_17350 [Verrucomicrobiota bacterium]